MMFKTFTQCSLRCMLAGLMMVFAVSAFAQDDCASATGLTAQVGVCTSFTLGSNTTATASGDGAPSCGNFATGEDTWFTVSVPATGELNLEVSTAGGPTDWAMSAYSGACGALVELDCDDDDGPGLFPEINLTGLTPGDDVFVQVWEWGNNATGDFNICANDNSPPPAIANDDCGTATPLPVNGACVNTLGSNTGATASGETPAPSCGDFASGEDVWYSVIVPGDGIVNLEVSNAGGPTDMAMSVYSGACGALAEIECNDDGGPGLFPAINLAGQTPGDQLFVRVWEWGNNADGLFNICAVGNAGPAGPPNDECAGATPLDVAAFGDACTNVLDSNVGATNGNPNPAPSCGLWGDGSRDLWYSMEVPASGSLIVEVSTAGGLTDWAMSMWGGACGALTEIECDDDDGPGLFPFLEVNGLTPGETVYVNVWEWGTSADSEYNICASAGCSAPDMVCQDIDIIADNDDPIVITTDDIDDGSTAECGGLMLSLSNTNFTCLDDGSNVVTLTGTDANGGTGSCMATVNIINTFIATEVGCIGDVNVTLGDDCSARVTPAMVLTGNNLECAHNIEITVDGGNSDVIQGCGDHTYMAEIFDENGELINTCWGSIFAEDKTDPVVDCPNDTDNITITRDAYTLGGDLDGLDPTLELNNYSCFTDVFNPLDGDHPYEVQTFRVTADDVYSFVVNSDWGDANVAIYQGGFDADNPCENIIGHNEDADPLVVGVNFDPGLRFSLPLIPGETYQLFVSNWDPDDLGNYTVDVFADGNGGIVGVNPQDLDVDFDLLCGDVDHIAFTFPQSWIVNANGTLDFNATRNTFFGGSTAALNDFLDKLGYTGIPEVTDNCGQVVVTLSDVVEQAGDCGEITLTRTFSAADRYNSDCIGDPRTDACDQIITFRNPTIADLQIPPVNAVIECDEGFATDGAVGGPDDNPAASSTGYPFFMTAFGFFDLNQTYCNFGASYSDEPRINVCEGTYKFRREWNIIDWCSPADNTILDQFVKVGDYTGPNIKDIPEVINVSTSPFDCLAYITIPTPTIEDGNGCSSAHATSYTVLAFGEAFFAGGNIADGDVVAAPIGEHILVLCAEDDCGNETCERYNLNVTDEIEPTAVCNDELNVSIGGGDVANGIEGIARVFAVDFDEGSNDNCGEVTVEVRRNYWRNDTCDPSANRWSPWGEYVDFYCCDINNEITIELRVTDEAGNTNVCWQVVTPEDKLNPFCYAPEDVELTCSDLPLAFPGDIQTAYDEDFAGTSIMMSAIFGTATGTDNCAVDTIVERTPNIQVNECGWGSITRRFEAWQLRPEGDVNGNGRIDINEVFRSTNSCSQDIVITEVHDFEIDFPEDASADCGDPDVPTIITTADGCDVLSVNIGDPVIFEATGDECYKYSVTYDVINWCVWDGEYEGLVLPRITEDDGEPLPVDRAVEGNERPVVRVVSSYGAVDDNCDGIADPGQGLQYTLIIDRRHSDRDGDSFINDVRYDNIPGNGFDCIPADQFGRRNYGRYIYTQFVKVYDSTPPVVEVGEYGGPTDNCPDLLPGQFGDDDGNCEEAVSIPFSVSDECELFDGDGNLVVSIVSAELDAFAVDANGDGFIKSNEFVADESVMGNITDNGDGTYSFDGTFPIIPNAMGDNVVHAIRVLFEDGCGNQTSEYIEFDVIDCKGPAPVCINGLTVTLMPQEEGGCAMAIWASDFEGSPIYDCTGQGPEVNQGLLRVTKYAIYRAADVEADPNFVPSPDDTGLVLTQDDEETTVVYVYAFDEDGNYDFCETYVLVQQHVDCGPGTGTLSGVIMTEESETVEGVQVNVNGGEASMTTNTDGTFSFTLAEFGDYTVTPFLNAEPLNGVSTFDLVLMSKHILGVQSLDSPYKRIAADVNRSESITTLDLIQLRKLILNITTEFENNTSWRFVDASYSFPQVSNPWYEAFPELINENDLEGDVVDVNFVGVKIGDVNGNAQANALAGDDRTLNGEFNFAVENGSLVAGNVYTVAFRAEDMDAVEGFQGTLRLNGAELVDIEYGVATAQNFGLRFVDEGMITTSWNGKATSEDVLFSLVIRPTVDAELSDVLSVNSRYTAAEAYGNGNTMNVGVVFDSGEVAGANFELYQNTPNPFRAETMISFELPADAEVTLTVNDASGRVLTVIRGDFAAGYNTVNLAKSQIQGASGVLSYTISTDGFTATKTMIAVK